MKEGESIESALKRFKKATEKAGILSEIRKREHYEKPSVKRKKKALAAKKRAVKKQQDILKNGKPQGPRLSRLLQLSAGGESFLRRRPLRD